MAYKKDHESRLYALVPFFCFIYLSITLERSGRMLENAHACSKLCWKLAGLSNFHAERLETLLPLCCACGRGSKVFNGSV